MYKQNSFLLKELVENYIQYNCDNGKSACVILPRKLSSCKFIELFFLYFSFMLVGDPFAGKTKVLNALAQTLTLMTERGHGDENINKVPDSELTVNLTITGLILYFTSPMTRLSQTSIGSTGRYGANFAGVAKYRFSLSRLNIYTANSIKVVFSKSVNCEL